MIMSLLRLPSSTYRLQFNHQFTFKQAIGLIDYFHALGISDCYASPIVKSQPGSLHGYDIVDHCQINPEIGTIEEFHQFSAALQQKGMGLLVDIVPNHMSVGASNKWWNDVLENGPSSIYAKYFNIIWNPPKAGLQNKVLLPVLGQQFGKVIENQEIKVGYEAGSFFIEYMGRHFPLNPCTWPSILTPIAHQMEGEVEENSPHLLELQSIITALNHLPGIGETDPEKCKERNREKEIIKKRIANLLEHQPTILNRVLEELVAFNGNGKDPHSFDRLEELLKAQAYRLSYWRVTNDEINYRRFFDINDLAGMRVEDEAVFASIHEFVLKLVQQGCITGFRIDHVDGLFDPEQYLYRLQESCFEMLRGEKRRHVDRQFYTVVEKILIGNEHLNPNWLTFGTTGYDYLNSLNGLFVVTESEQKIKQIYAQFIEKKEELIDVVHSCKKLILIISMSSELHMLAKHLGEVSEQHRWSRDYTQESLRFALRDVIACFPVYRSYIRLSDKQVSGEDKKNIMHAIQRAKALNPASDLSIFDFIESVLLLEDPEGLSEEDILHRRNFIMRFQQLTGPVMAKGLEDTALYRHYPLASLNDVGMNPHSFGISIEDFHKRNEEMRKQWPHTLLTTFTHDTKRSEDVRARINVLSENPQEWQQAIGRWQSYNANKKNQLDHCDVPDANEEYLLYQTLVGSWPLYPMDASARIQYIERIDKYMSKALREAKIHTSWINVNSDYEKLVSEFIRKILDPHTNEEFLKDFSTYISPIVRAGLFNSLSQTLLKMTTPGIPDFYQGSELWEFTLVDPDNRHSVDYSYRHQLLLSIKEKAVRKSELIDQLLQTPEDGRIKLYLISEVLNFRHAHLQLFQEGSYQPLILEGERAKHAIAFSRVDNEQSLIVIAGRFYTQLFDVSTTAPLGEKAWKDTQLLTEGVSAGIYCDLLSGQEFQVDKQISLADLFSKLPLALLYKES
jgi:(1->4)-alpha-D-glucan 1-alpha-D-glucosylmutase